MRPLAAISIQPRIDRGVGGLTATVFSFVPAKADVLRAGRCQFRSLGQGTCVGGLVCVLLHGGPFSSGGLD